MTPRKQIEGHRPTVDEVFLLAQALDVQDRRDLLEDLARVVDEESQRYPSLGIGQRFAEARNNIESTTTGMNMIHARSPKQ